jgi:hypothetical protein
MNMEQGYVFREIAPDGRAVVHVHELGRDEPDGDSGLLHPVVRQEQEVTIQPGESTDVAGATARASS